MSCLHSRERRKHESQEIMMREMTKKEIWQAYRKEIYDALRLYNPFLNLIFPSRFLTSYLKLPFFINLTLLTGTMLAGIVLVLGLGTMLCSTASAQAQCLSEKVITLAMIVALISSISMIAVTYAISKNYLAFLQKCRDTITQTLPYQQPQVNISLTERSDSEPNESEALSISRSLRGGRNHRLN